MDLLPGTTWKAPEESAYYYLVLGSSDFCAYYNVYYDSDDTQRIDKWWLISSATTPVGRPGIFDMTNFMSQYSDRINYKLISEDQAKAIISIANLPFF